MSKVTKKIGLMKAIPDEGKKFPTKGKKRREPPSVKAAPS
jgi:hypothetical protein